LADGAMQRMLSKCFQGQLRFYGVVIEIRARNPRAPTAAEGAKQ
jgi:hypothetical protein